MSVFYSEKASDSKRFSEALDKANYTYLSKTHIEKDDGALAIGWNAYGGYPIRQFTKDGVRIIFEGRIYNKPAETVDQEIVEIAGKLMRNVKESERALATWLLETDGDFVIACIEEKTNDFVIFNDALGRLPTYYSIMEEAALVSREIGVVLGMAEQVDIDKEGLCQLLMFGYPIGDRTLFENVTYLKPASFVRKAGTAFRIDVVHNFNFDNYIYRNKSIGENADAIVELLKIACRNRAGKKNIVSLSGGLDSRTLAASFSAQSIPFESVTYRGSYSHADRDLEIAELLAVKLGSKWTEYELKSDPEIFHPTQIGMKRGLNFLGMSYIHEFLSSISSRFGSDSLYFTGDGGDKILPDMRPQKRIVSIDGLADYIISHNQVFTIDQVSAMTGVRTEDLRERTRTLISDYPEKTFIGKYKHFMVYERGIKWLFEGEDRNRYYFWSVTPFYAVQLFDYTMNCPDVQKSGYELYKEVLVRLSKPAADMDVANWNSPITSGKFRMKQITRAMYKRLPERSRRAIRGKMKNTSVDVEANEIRDMNISNILDPSCINELDQKQYHYLLTLCHLSENLGEKLNRSGGDSSP
jgi:asparagine synthase (glutamine-hydrolysing)